MFVISIVSVIVLTVPPDPVPGEVRHAALEGDDVVVEVAASEYCTAVVMASGRTVIFDIRQLQ